MDTVRASTHSDAGLALGRYRLVRRLGSGGFGVVWLAHDERLDREVAVKRIPVDDPDVARRAEREAKAAARLAHPGIVALFEAGREEDAVYLVSELVRGQTLGQLTAEGALSDRDVLVIGATLCDALAHAHKRGVVHRDVKPGNVIVPEVAETGGAAKLTDFGIAQLLGEDVLTRTGDIVGTLAYMAPEQAEGRAITAMADLYSLGLVLYEALSGLNPVRGRSPASTARRVGTQLPPLERVRRDLPRELCAAVDAAVQPRPEHRGTLRALRMALKAATAEADDVPGTVEAGPLDAVTRVSRLAALPLAPRPPRGGGYGAHSLTQAEIGPAGAYRPGRRPPAGGRDARGVQGEGRWGPGDGIAEAGGYRPGRKAPGAGGRAVAAVLSGALCTAALGGLEPVAPIAPLAGGVLAAAAVALLPRLGHLATAIALAVWLTSATDGGNGTGEAVVLLAAVVPTVLALWRAAPAWLAAPALAPLLGLATLAGAWPAVAGQARTVVQRAALGALGAWWLMLAEVASGRVLLLGPPPGARPRATWADSASEAASHVLAPVLTQGALGVAVVWAVGAAVLPWVARGRVAAVDLVLVTAWTAGLAAATRAVAAALPWSGGPPAPRGLVAGAVAAGVVALCAGAARPASEGRSRGAGPLA